MKPTRNRGRAVMFPAVALLLCGAATTWPSSMPQGQPPLPTVTDEIDGMQVLTQGAVHEAFAEPVVYDPKPGPVVPKEPPGPIEEQPPDHKPDAPDVQWIPGYWSYDEDRKDFVWISGIWRDPPEGREWVPGYWNQAESGYQWVPGAWIPVSQGEITPTGTTADQGAVQTVYLPQPPPTLEVGPNTPPPASEVFWSPGSWIWRESHFVWTPGFWADVQPDWVWVPAHYIWTPGGYLFIPGYWDMPIARRGILFAPVYYSQPITTVRLTHSGFDVTSLETIY